MDTDEDGKRLLYSGDDLKEAMYAGDIDSFDHVYNYLSEQGLNVNSTLKRSLKNEWKEGRISISNASKYLKEYLGYSDLKAYETISEWKDRIKYADLDD